MKTYSDPSLYWESRLQNQFDLSGVGYRSLGSNYNAIMYKQRLLALEQGLKEVDGSFTNKRVLEIGCGTGFYTRYCAGNHVKDYVGLDITEVSVSHLQIQFPQYRFFQSDITEGRINLSEVFDIVIIADVLFHIVDDEAFETAIQNISAYLDDNGLLLLSDSFPKQTVQTAAHVRNRSLADYQTFLPKYNLEIKHIEPIFAVLHPPISAQGVSWPWRFYAWLWRYGWRIARLTVVDKTLPKFLAGIDRNYGLQHWGTEAPNSKWLIATKNNVA